MGKFKKGQTGNPGGRPKADPQFKARARELSIEALERLTEHMRDRRAKHVSIKACIAIIEHGEGKAMQPVKHSGEIKTGHGYEQLSTAELLTKAHELGVRLPKALPAPKESK